MAYKGHHWDKGELITSEKLNHMESGIAEALGNALIARATGSGQVTAEDAAAVPLANLVIAGKSEQAVTIGVQLLDMSDASGGASYGITATVNSDGTYVSNGTATNSNINIWFRGGYNIAPATDNSNVLLILEQGKTYVISDIILLTVVNGAPVSVKGMYTCNVTDEFKVTGIRHPDVPSGTKLSNKKYYPMVNAGTTAKPWEPYTGGQPSPSPAYPQPIISTGDDGNVEVTVTGDTQSQAVTIPLAEPLRGLREYQDRIMCKAGVWGVERNIGVVDNRQWDLSEVYQGTAGHRFRHIAYNRSKKKFIAVLNTMYSQKQLRSYVEEGNYISTNEMGNGFIHIRTLNPDFDTLEAFKVAMANAVTIYPLATPTWKPFPAETQSALNALTAYQGRTTITVTAGGPAAAVGLEYVRDINTVIADLQAQITALKGGKTS